MDVNTKSLPPARVTFRRLAGPGQANLIPMVDGVDIPNIQGIVVQQNVAGSFMVVTVLLPDGVVVE